MRQLRKDMDSCAGAVKQHRVDFAYYIAEQNKMREADQRAQNEMREEDRRERTKTMRWIVGVVLSSSALVIAAVGVLAGYLS